VIEAEIIVVWFYKVEVTLSKYFNFQGESSSVCLYKRHQPPD
jgi:hypothetical protein